jgi:hypothetical protein
MKAALSVDQSVQWDRYLRRQECRLICLRVRKRSAVPLALSVDRLVGWLGRGGKAIGDPICTSLVDVSTVGEFRAFRSFVAGKATAFNGAKFEDLLEEVLVHPLIDL